MTNEASSISDAELLSILSRFSAATISVYDRDLRFKFVNESFARTFGLTPPLMVGRTILEIDDPENFPAFMPAIVRALAGECVTYERKVVAPAFNGWRVISLTPWRDETGEVIGVVNTGLSVHEIKTTAEALRTANERLTSHMENSPLAVIEFDPLLNVTFWSPRAVAMFGWRLGGINKLSFGHLLAPTRREDESLEAAFSRLQTGSEKSNRVDTTNLRSDGTVIHCEWFNSVLTDAAGDMVSIMSLAQDVSERVKMLEHVRALADRDSLTGLLNHSALRLQMQRELQSNAHAHTNAALLFIDLDGFKNINDQMGHSTGDEVLCEVGRRIKLMVRADDAVARVGGDEFAVLLTTDATAEATNEICRRILSAINEPFKLASNPWTLQRQGIDASIGVIFFTPPESDINSLFKRADAAMYEAKRAGKGCVRYGSSVADN